MHGTRHRIAATHDLGPFTDIYVMCFGEGGKLPLDDISDVASHFGEIHTCFHDMCLYTRKAVRSPRRSKAIFYTLHLVTNLLDMFMNGS